MTEYGRGPGSEPWHPDDPLYGDGGWDGQQAQAGQQSPYGGRPQQHYPEQQQYQQQHGNGGWGNGHQDAYGQAQQQYQQEYGDLGQQQYPGHNQQQQQYTGHDQQQYDQVNGGWGNGSHQHAQGPYVADPADPYGGQPMAYGAGQPDFYSTPDAYPPAEEPSRRSAEPAPPPAPEPAPTPQPAAERADWDPGPDQGEHAFFAGGGDDDEADEADEAEERGGRGERKGRGGKSGKPGKGGKKRRSGCACLVVVMVFGGGFAGVSYYGYQFYQDRFAEAPDYTGDGTNETVTVTIPKGAFGSTIGQKLKEAGVVKSVDAFTTAQANEPNGSIQAGVYLLKKQMSAESALALMLDPTSQNNFTVIEGERNNVVYTKIDKELGLKKGTTEDVAEKDWSTLGLPDWANDNDDIKDPLEGFLFPSTYPVAKGMKPKDVLKEMVDLAKAKYEELDLEDKAEDLKLESPLQVLTVASLVQAEGDNKKDYKKIARVVYNRLDTTNNLETFGLLDFDSTVNYLRGESKLATGSVDSLRQIDDPYNTYKIKGLPPGPIDNPGHEAIEGALNPAKGDWYYFVSIKDETLFAVTNEEHNRNREKYQEEQNG
ncbi:endolytic transglycosylase MltG [Streptomyces adelaidensis]|uniref:endolytic transglycosylase MltG n=1 Tax=Streptomyces adelaidensis TaxID=2796465 RepID=UPI0019045781|nr:endolytic transglycosylase MltG [Streptomyces adelaidensis]